MNLKTIYEKFVNRRVNASFKIPDGRTFYYNNCLIISVSDLSVVFEDYKTGAIKNFLLTDIIRMQIITEDSLCSSEESPSSPHNEKRTD